MNTADYEKCARRIVDALRLSPGEKILLKRDARTFAPLVAPLENLIQASGAEIHGVIRAEELSASSDAELEKFRRLFADADVFIWLPELHQGNPPALGLALTEW